MYQSYIMECIISGLGQREIDVIGVPTGNLNTARNRPDVFKG
jgi:hypothetical protein